MCNYDPMSIIGVVFVAGLVVCVLGFLGTMLYSFFLAMKDFFK